MRHALFGLTLVAFSVACSNDHSLGYFPDGGPKLDLAPKSGWVDARLLPSPDSGGQAWDGPASGSTLNAQDPNVASLIGSWTGYIENYQFASGSDTLRLTFVADSSGGVSGQLVLGAGAPPPPATDPNVGYPPGVAQLRPPWLEGFPFTVFGANLSGPRLRFSIKGHEPWMQWCALQPPPSDGSLSCVPGGNGVLDIPNGYCITFVGTDPTPIQFDCWKMMLCLNQTCLCDPTGCAAYLDPVTDPNDPRTGQLFLTPPPVASFDVFLSGGVASGSVAGTFSNANVHFTKDP